MNLLLHFILLIKTQQVKFNKKAKFFLGFDFRWVEVYNFFFLNRLIIE